MGVAKLLSQLLGDLGQHSTPSLSQIGTAARGSEKIPTASAGDLAVFEDDAEVLDLINSMFPPMPSATNSAGMPVHLLPAQVNAAREKLLPAVPAEEMLEQAVASIKMADGSPIGPVIDAANARRAENVARKDEGAAKSREEGENKAQWLLDQLASGNASDIRDVDLRLNDPVAETAFNQHLWNNYDLPMDAASREERARSGPFPFGEQEWYRGSSGNSAAPRTERLFAAQRPDTAETYLPVGVTEDTWNERFSVAPLRFRDTMEDLNFSPREVDVGWNNLVPDSAAITTRGGDILEAADFGMSDPFRSRSTDEIVFANEGRAPGSSVTFEGIRDLGGGRSPQTPFDNIRATMSPENVRSRFARFDPRLAHLRNLNASVVPPLAGGAAIGGMSLAPTSSEASDMPQPDVQRELLDSINAFVGNAPGRTKSRLTPEDIAAMEAQFGTLQPANETTRSQIREGTRGFFDTLGASPAMANRVAGAVAGSEMDPNVGAGGVGIADLVPFLGTGLAAEEGINAYERGDYTGAGLAAADVALSTLPVVGAIAGSPATRRAIKNFASNEAGSVPAPDMRRVSTRLPTAVKATENPFREALSIDFPTATAGDVGQHNVGLLGETPGFARIRDLPPEEAAKAYVDQSAGNLGFLMDQMTPAQIDSTRKWYAGAGRFADELANRSGMGKPSTSGALAMLSPQKDWFQNASLGERLVDIVKDRGGMTATSEMRDVMERLPAYTRAIDDMAKKTGIDADALRADLLGTRFDQFDDPTMAAMWARAFDEAHNSRAYRELTPEGQLGDFVKTASGAPQKVAWGSFNEIGKALQSLRSGDDMDLISRLLGQQHKVRSFYNNIFDPFEELGKFGDVTGDTHAVAAGQLRPLSGASTQVLQNFGSAPMVSKRPADWAPTRSSSLTGVQGTYGINTEAVRKIAEERGLRPREAQSVTWEAIRALFEATAKRGANAGRADDIWREYDAGRIGLDDARRAIFDSFGGFGTPTWGQSRSGLLDPEAGASSYR